MQTLKVDTTVNANADASNVKEVASPIDVKQIELEALKKEDDEFSALEGKFMTELGL